MSPGSVVMTLADLDAACSRVQFRDWTIEAQACGPEQFRVRWTFLELDNMKPKDTRLYPQTCRWWLIERGDSHSSVFKTLFLAAQQGVIHEFQEQFTVCGQPMLNPHAEVPA